MMSHSLAIAPQLQLGMEITRLWAKVRLFFADVAARAHGVETPDEALMAAYIAGDQAAFRRLFDRYAPLVYRAARRRGMDEADAKDVVQQTFVHFHQGRREFRAGAKVRPWLYTIAFNILRDLGRKHQTQHRLKERYAGEVAHTLPSEAPEETHGRQREAALKAAMERLSTAQREVLELHYFEEMSFQDIGVLLGNREGAIRVCAHRGYRALKRILSAGRQEEELS